MLPSRPIIIGCLRWLDLLRTSSISQTSLILRSDPQFTDLTQGQYQLALELLKNLGALKNQLQSWVLAEHYRVLPRAQIRNLLFEKIIESSAPAWLPDSDLLIPDPSDIPGDAATVACVLGLKELEAFRGIRNVHSRIDLAKRKQIGDAGELALLQFLEQYRPGSTVHVASLSDGFGYDIAFQHGDCEWHLEVKSTTRRGRMNIHVSRHEYEESTRDPNWRLIIIGLDRNLQMVAIATLRPGHLVALAPSDISSKARWQSAAFEIVENNLIRGLRLFDEIPHKAPLTGSLQLQTGCPETWFEWLPLP